MQSRFGISTYTSASLVIQETPGIVGDGEDTPFRVSWKAAESTSDLTCGYKHGMDIQMNRCRAFGMLGGMHANSIYTTTDYYRETGCDPGLGAIAFCGERCSILTGTVILPPAASETMHKDWPVYKI